MHHLHPPRQLRRVPSVKSLIARTKVLFVQLADSAIESSARPAAPKPLRRRKPKPRQ